MTLNIDDLKSLDGRTLTGQTVEFSKRTLVRSAKDCRFQDCEIVLDPKGMPAARFSNSRFSFLRCVFEGCTLVAKGPVRGLELGRQSQLLRCTFKGGPYIEAQFGVGPVEVKYVPSDFVPVIACDFREADLRDARFFRTDLSQVQLPKWPHIVVVAKDGDLIYTKSSPHRPALTVLVEQVESYAWESDEACRSVRALVSHVGVRDDEATVQVCHIDDVVKSRGLSSEQVRVALEKFGHPAIRF